MPYAAVRAEPVSARATKSRPVFRAGMTWAWIVVGAVHPRSRIARWIRVSTRPSYPVPRDCPTIKPTHRGSRHGPARTRVEGRGDRHNGRARALPPSTDAILSWPASVALLLYYRGARRSIEDGSMLRRQRMAQQSGPGARDPASPAGKVGAAAPPAPALRLEIRDPEAVRPDLLETFPYEYSGSPATVEISTDEFTTVCPWSGLPDFGTVAIRYLPRERVLELRSFKYYLLSYRSVGIYQEHAANRILQDLVRACAPEWMELDLDYRVRGGIRTIVRVRWPAPAA